MGFDFKKDQDNKDQLSLFDFQMPKADFTPSRNEAYDYNAYLIAQQMPTESKTPRFVTLSAAFHAAAVIALAVLTVPLIEQVKTETVTIEIEELPHHLPTRGIDLPATQGSTSISEELPVAEMPTKADIVVARKTAPAPKAKAVIAKELPAKKVATNTQPAIVPKTDAIAVPMTVDDIDAPELNEGALADVPVVAPLTDDLKNDFASVDNSQEQLVDSEQERLEALAAGLEQEQTDSFSSLESDANEEAKRLAALQENVRRKNNEAIASALAAERASALAKAKADLAQKNSLAEEGNGLAGKKGLGAGNNGNSQLPQKQVAGTPDGIRSLDQLKQMPGNPRPAYDREERRRGDQGQAVFYAYINKAGYPTQLRLAQSTGFRNLDQKSLVAIKKWRFYPGQEGWVEIPFRWDLKGGVQQDGGTLRRSVSQR